MDRASGATGYLTEKEVALMKRILLVMSVAALMAAMLALMAVPAFATIHPLSNSECSGLSEDTVAGSQDPPGLTPGGTPSGGGADVAQPVFAVLDAQGSDSPAFKQEPAPGSENFCPAP